MPKKMILFFAKYFLEKKLFIKSLYHKRRKKIPTPSHTIKEKCLNNPHLPTLRKDQTSPSHTTQEITLD